MQEKSAIHPIELDSTDFQTGQNKGRYRKKELLFLLVSLLAFFA